MFAELEGLICSGPRRGKQFTYALLDERVPSTKDMSREQALVELARRYFRSRGPATLHDFAKWSGLTVTEARQGLEGVERRLVREVVNGKTLWFSPSRASATKQRSNTAHLLPIYDEYVSGYKDRSAMIDAPTGARLRAIGNALNHIVAVDGRIVGTWKRRFDGGAVIIKTEILDQLTSAQQRAVSAAAQAYGDFVGMSVRTKGVLV
jgi:hypothetical protein